MSMKTVIMAGGNGTRISSIASDIPKPMIKVNGVPVLEHAIECLRAQGFTDLIFTVSHLGKIIMEYFGNGRKVSPVTGKSFGVNITYYNEEKPLGNAGALIKLRDRLGDEPFLLLNADVIFDVNFSRMIKFHKDHHALATLLTHPNSHPYDSGLIIADNEGTIKEWLTKEDKRPEFYRNRVNAGIHVIDPAILKMAAIDDKKIGTIGEDGKAIKVDLDRQILKPLAGTGAMFCYDSPEYVKDMGTPERFHIVEADYISGHIKARNLSNKQKAVFLDRDGVINKYVGFLRDINDFELIDGVAEAIKKINVSGYLCIVVTNQPVIARGEITWDALQTIHNKMETLLGHEGAYVDGIYICPHHPHKGYVGEVTDLKIDCDCRKPKPGMLMEAAKDLNISLSDSWIVGDSENDMKAGRSAGCKTILVNGIGTLGLEGDVGQMDTVGSLLEFVNTCL